MTGAYERTEFYETRLAAMAQDVQKVTQRLLTNKQYTNEVKVLRAALKNILTTPEGEQLGSYHSKYKK